MKTKINPNMSIEDVLLRWPSTAKVFVKWGMRAMVCGEPAWGTIRELAERSGVSDLDGLCKELSEAAEGPQVFLE
ncbi:MAG: hypothetical protein ABIM88_04170 [candidate division WOR-3 bacterium]